MDRASVKAQLKKQFSLDKERSKVLVVGLGVTGMSVARFLHGLGFNFAITDSRQKPQMIAEFFREMPDTPAFMGGFDDNAFKVATHLVVSPGVPLKENAIVQARANGAKILSDIDLFVCSVEAPIVAITGSNGKSTVTTMLGEMAKAAGKNPGIGGNLGTAALDLLHQDSDLYVLELSSFQLERISVLNAAASTVLNVTADHLDRHVDIEDYAKEKQKIFQGDGVMVINLDDPLVSAMRMPERRTLTFSTQTHADFFLKKIEDAEYLMQDEKRLMPRDELPLEGRHNAANALAAMALGHAIGLDREAMCSALRKFQGLAHRMQRVAEIDGITWVNDSKATNIGACVAALQGYDRKVVLIAGGDAKGADMNELAPAIKSKAKSVVLIGKDAAIIKQAINGDVPVYLATNMEEAVKIAAGLADKGESVLLSPACASLDQYQNYQDRGNKFTKAVLELMA